MSNETIATTVANNKTRVSPYPVHNMRSDLLFAVKQQANQLNFFEQEGIKAQKIQERIDILHSLAESIEGIPSLTQAEYRAFQELINRQ